MIAAWIAPCFLFYFLPFDFFIANCQLNDLLNSRLILLRSLVPFWEREERASIEAVPAARQKVKGERTRTMGLSYFGREDRATGSVKKMDTASELMVSIYKDLAASEFLPTSAIF